jgi:hypothetical protein
MVSCLFLSFLLITSGTYLFIDKSGLACCFALRVVGAVFVVGVGVKFAQYASQSTCPHKPNPSRETVPFTGGGGGG